MYFGGIVPQSVLAVALIGTRLEIAEGVEPFIVAAGVFVNTVTVVIIGFTNAKEC